MKFRFATRVMVKFFFFFLSIILTVFGSARSIVYKVRARLRVRGIERIIDFGLETNRFFLLFFLYERSYIDYFDFRNRSIVHTDRATYRPSAAARVSELFPLTTCFRSLVPTLQRSYNAEMKTIVYLLAVLPFYLISNQSNMHILF